MSEREPTEAEEDAALEALCGAVPSSSYLSGLGLDFPKDTKAGVLGFRPGPFVVAAARALRRRASIAASISRLDVAPGDVVVARVEPSVAEGDSAIDGRDRARHEDGVRCAHVAKMLRRAVPEGVRVLVVLGDEVELSTVRAQARPPIDLGALRRGIRGALSHVLNADREHAAEEGSFVLAEVLADVLAQYAGAPPLDVAGRLTAPLFPPPGPPVAPPE